MTVTINASTSSGLITTADNSGILGIQTAGTTALTIDASQNVGIGVTPSAWGSGYKAMQVGSQLSVAYSGGFAIFSNNAYNNSGNKYIASDFATQYYQQAGQHVWGTAASGTAGNAITFTQAMTLTAGGDLLVGRTNATIDSTNFGFKTSQEGLTACSRNVNGSSASLQVYGNAGELRVLGNGNAQNTNNSYGAISDVKLKENIVDTTPKLDKLNQVRVVNYNLIGQEQKQIGVIAQELEQIFPSMVEQTLDCDSKGNDIGTTTKSVKYSVFVPMLIKAMQEQQAIIESLTQRITALEGA